MQIGGTHDKGRGVLGWREELVRQHEAGDPSAFVALADMVADFARSMNSYSNGHAYGGILSAATFAALHG